MSGPTLAKAELAVMELLWDAERLTARDIREKLYPKSTKAQHGTVQKLRHALVPVIVADIAEELPNCRSRPLDQLDEDLVHIEQQARHAKAAVVGARFLA